MTILNILQYPDPRLRTKAEPVAEVDAGVRQLVDDMFATMYESSGVGLAATQVDVHKQIIVIDISGGVEGSKSDPICLINPEIIEQHGCSDIEEGCISVPGFYACLSRADVITVRALNRNGKSYEREAQGLLSVCIQHEMDHLQGKLFVDMLSEMKRNKIRKALEKKQRQQRQKQTIDEPVAL
ncbi:MAG: peptide deformylase [Gammaproteobacteria bacterium]|nr:peptide deformylase [Gammaproteobacteria bacterium]